MANELSKIGQLVKRKTMRSPSGRNNSRGSRALAAEEGVAEIDTYEDHRFAMSFAILGSYDLLGDGEPWLAIKNPGCCGKTFPDFFQVLEQLRHD